MTIIIKSTEKSRDLTVFQLFDILQQEYVVCEIRAQIYPIEKHKIYWRETMEKKKEKILDISKRNSLPSIFDDKRIKESFISKIVPSIGFPQFIYKDASQQLIQEKWDIHNYYTVGIEVSVMNDIGKILYGIIEEVFFNKKRAKINIKDIGIQEFDFETITRKLTL